MASKDETLNHKFNSSTRNLANAAGSLTDSYDYNAFGETISHSGTTANPYQYTGEQLDAATGLYNLRARFYAPATDRFISRDIYDYNPADPSQFNRYSYSANNPVNYIDPAGLQAFYEYSKLTENDEEEAAALEGEEYTSEGEELLSETDNNLASSERTKHILDGDGPKSGGHRPGLGKPGKTEFPAGWSDIKIMNTISDIATDPDLVLNVADATSKLPYYEKVVEGVLIRVVMALSGEIWTGFLPKAPRNPWP